MRTGLLLLFLGSLFSCSTTIRSSSEIGEFSLKITVLDSNSLLATISGQNIDSALWIKSYEVRYHRGKVILTIERSLGSTGNSGPYAIQFIIPESYREVVLGDEVIWKRKTD